MYKHVNRIDLHNCCKIIYMILGSCQKSASIQPRTSPTELYSCIGSPPDVRIQISTCKVHQLPARETFRHLGKLASKTTNYPIRDISMASLAADASCDRGHGSAMELAEATLPLLMTAPSGRRRFLRRWPRVRHLSWLSHSRSPANRITCVV